MLKTIILSVVIAAPLCGKPAEKTEVEPEVPKEEKMVDNVPTAGDGVPAANKKLNALKEGMQKTADDREAVIDNKANR